MPALPRSDASSIDADKLASEISRDIESDFIIAPHLSAVLKMSGADFVRSVLRDLESHYIGPQPPTTIMVPKPTGHFRPGAILEPFDRVVYHAISWLAFDIAPDFDGTRAISTTSRIIRDNRNGTSTRHSSWPDHSEQFTRLAHTYPYVLTLDIAHCFERIPQHALVNLLRGMGLAANAANLAEAFLLNARMRDSHGLLQGMLPSDYFGDLYLSRLDGHLERHGIDAVRYVDDVLIGGASEAELRMLHLELAEFIRRHGLQPNESKTGVFPGIDVLKAYTQIDQMFADAKAEVLDQLAGVDVDYGFGLDWEPTEIDPNEVTLTATKRLLAAAEENPADTDRILRFALKPLAILGDKSALPLALSVFATKPYMSRPLARYFARFPDEPAVIEKMVAVVMQPNDHAPFVVMHAVEILSLARELQRPALNALRLLYDRGGDDTYRALAAIALAKLGDASTRGDLLASYAHQRSQYMRLALLFAAQYFVQADRRTAKTTWATTRLGLEVAERVL